MKVLHINTIDTGGAAIAAIRLHELLLSKGIESKMLFLYRSGRVKVNESYYFEDLFKFKVCFNLLVKLNIIYNRRFTFYKPKIYFNGPDSLFNISNHPMFQWADVIHFHWVVKFLNWKKVFKYKSKKYVWTFHDMNPFTGGEHYRTGYNDEFKLVSTINLKRKLKYLNGVDLQVITPSDWMNQLVKKSYVFNNHNVITLRNPVPFEIFKPNYEENLQSRKSTKIKLLFVAENPNDVRKGFGLLIEAIKKNPSGSNYSLIVLGNNPDLNGLDIEVDLVGNINNPYKLAEIYNSADYFIIPSIEDNLPNTVSESLLCGTPVIGFNVGGIPEMIINNQNGFLVDSENNLVEVLNSIKMNQFKKEEVFNTVKSKLNEEDIFQSYLKIISFTSQPQ
ncbi:MAG: glycosyltransferase [Bacteroidota bacterium]|nr:glycosyltransferase [Bacteroidota bacterium]